MYGKGAGKQLLDPQISILICSQCKQGWILLINVFNHIYSFAGFQTEFLSLAWVSYPCSKPSMCQTLNPRLSMYHQLIPRLMIVNFWQIVLSLPSGIKLPISDAIPHCHRPPPTHTHTRHPLSLKMCQYPHNAPGLILATAVAVASAHPFHPPHPPRHPFSLGCHCIILSSDSNHAGAASSDAAAAGSRCCTWARVRSSDSCGRWQWPAGCLHSQKDSRPICRSIQLNAVSQPE